MDTIRDLLFSLRVQLRERLKNLLYGSFIIAWSILNFRLLLVLFGDGKWAEKITYIDSKLYPNWSAWALYGYALPLVAALSYVLASPFVNRAVARFVRQQERETASMLLEIEGEIPVSKAEAELLRKGLLKERALRIELQNDATEVQAELSRQIDALQDEKKQTVISTQAVSVKSQLNDGLEQLTDELIETSRTPLPVTRYELSERYFVGVAQRTVLSLVSRGLDRRQVEVLHSIRSGQRLNAQGLKKMLGLDDHEAKVVIDQLVGLNVVDRSFDTAGKNVIEINSAGTQALEALLQQGFEHK